MKKILFVTAIIFFITTRAAFASSTYVLPYPSVMPGGIAYKLHLVWEKVMQYWYFGDFGQFEYNLKESDKYLVEAKTLFEYNQYLLGFQALEKSNTYFSQTLPFLLRAQENGKDITDKSQLLRSAATKHIEELHIMFSETPSIVTWNPEKTSASILSIHLLIDQAIKTCQKDL